MKEFNRRGFLIASSAFFSYPLVASAVTPSRRFVACKARVHNRGIPPDSFLNEIVDWARQAPDEIFAPNSARDIYSFVVADLGPWRNLLHRKAALVEVLRVLGGFESSWNWGAGIDTTNPYSSTACTEEAGIFQCSGNSMSFHPSLRALLLAATGRTDCDSFRTETKNNHRFAIEYCARLIRFTVNHHGPIKHRHINRWLSDESVSELEHFLA